MFEKLGGRDRELPVYYTAKNINATAGSRTAIDDDLEVGMVVVMDPYQNDGGETSVDGSYASAKPVNVTRPQTSFLGMKKYVVTSVPSSVNDIPLASAATQRRGGMISVVEAADDIQALVDGTTDVAVGDLLEVTNGSFNLTKRAALTTQLTLLTYPNSASTDAAIQAIVANTGFGFVTADEGEYLIRSVINLQTRMSELATQYSGGVCAVALAARSTNSAALTRVNFSGNPIR